MHTLRGGVRAPEQTDAAHSDDAHARHAEVSRRTDGPAAGAAADWSVRRAALHERAGRGRAARPGHRPRGARQRGPVQVLRQELPGRVVPHRAPARAYRRPAVQVRVLREGVQVEASYEGSL